MPVRHLHPTQLRHGTRTYGLAERPRRIGEQPGDRAAVAASSEAIGVANPLAVLLEIRCARSAWRSNT